MNKTIRRMTREIDRGGRKLGISEFLPDDFAERILEEVLDCPHCHDDSADFPEQLILDPVFTAGVVRMTR